MTAWLWAMALTPIAIWVALPAIADLLAWLAGWRERREPSPEASTTARLLIVVPAHDEEASIAHCVGSLMGQDYPANLLSVVVIADNCTDATAALARAAGAEALEREGPDSPGKNRALAWAFDRLPLTEYDAVVIADADSIVEPDYARRIAATPDLRRTVGQTFDGTRNEFDNSLTRLGGLLIRNRYDVALPLKARAGLSCPLTGDGVVFGTDVIGSHFREIETITEGWELYAKLTVQGHRTRYIQKARLYAESTRSLGQSRTQRVRWTAGRRAVLGRYWRPILARPGLSVPQRLDLLAELTSPGPVMRGVIGLAGVTGALLLSPPGASVLAALFSTGVLQPAWYSLISLRTHPERLATVRSLSFLPLYAVWRLFVALRAMVSSGTSHWQRTDRNA